MSVLKFWRQVTGLGADEVGADVCAKADGTFDGGNAAGPSVCSLG
jgi:hypothetical protein